MKKETVIVCDDCGNEFNHKKIDFKTKITKVKSTEYEVTYYKCPKCGRAYLVCMLDYWGRKLQKRYVDALDGYRSAHHRGESKIMLDMKLQKVENFKQEALAYQQEILHKYGDLLPEEIFD